MTCSRWVTICADIADHPVVGVKSGAWMGWWIYLIANVNWRERAVHHKGRALTLKRGQMLAGRAYLAREWGCSEKQVRNFLVALEKNGMIEKVQSKGHFANVITVCNYDDYQKNQAREGQCEGQSRASEGPDSYKGNNSYNSEEKDRLVVPANELQKELLPAPAAPAKPKKSTRGSRLPVDWALPEDYRAWAKAKYGASDAAISNEAEKFRDHFLAAPGRHGVKEDWLATWRNWCRRARERSMENIYRKGGKPNGAPVFDDVASKRAAHDKLVRGQAAMAQAWEDAT